MLPYRSVTETDLILQILTAIRGQQERLQTQESTTVSAAETGVKAAAMAAETGVKAAAMAAETGVKAAMAASQS